MIYMYVTTVSERRDREFKDEWRATWAGLREERKGRNTGIES